MKTRKLLMIPGPIEFENDVLLRMAEPTLSHVDPHFIQSFAKVLDAMKKVFLAPSGQPFVVAGSGTLAMEMAVANLVEKDDAVLVISTGYFGQRYADILRRYGTKVDVLEAETGDIVAMELIEEQLKRKKYKLLTFTHVDTSTGVLNDAQSIGKLGSKYDVLTILDGVCSVSAEEIKQEDWGIDVVLTASQKAIGVPPGLALLVASPKAIDVFKNRKSPVANYYADWSNWLPIMEAYQNGKPSYFGTPPVNHIAALEVSLDNILAEGMTNRFQRHQRVGNAVREALRAMGLELLTKCDAVAANTLSTPKYPTTYDCSTFLKAVSQEGITLAGGLLADIKQDYFRIGHMGVVNRNDLLATIGAIEIGLTKSGSTHELGAGTASILKHF